MSTTLPKHMRAWTFSSCGQPRDILTLDRTYPVPDPPGKDDLLIRVSHVALNPGCYITMANISPWVRRLLGGKSTAIAEAEFSGLVHLAGPAASEKLSPGTRVFGNFPMMQLIAGAGALAEYIVVPQSSVAIVPPVMGLEEASGLGGAGQTAWNMFLEVDLKMGDRVLVNGGSGGVGTMVIQIAKARGAYVIATCSGPSTDLVKSLGADEVSFHLVYVSLSIDNELDSRLSGESSTPRLSHPNISKTTLRFHPRHDRYTRSLHVLPAIPQAARCINKCWQL